MSLGEIKIKCRTPVLKPNYFVINGDKHSALYDNLTKQVIRINHSAAKILELCNGMNIDKIMTATARTFKIDRSIAEKDVLEFLNDSGKDFIDWFDGSPAKAKNKQLTLQDEEQVQASVVWEVTNQCNLGCIHCLVEAGEKYRDEFTDEQCQKLLLALSEAGIEEITFSGGEPTLRPNFFQLLKGANDYGIETHIFTNGCIEKEVAVKIAKEATGVQTTLLGAIEDTHDKLTGVKGSWRKTCSSLEIFSKANLELLTISSVVMKENIAEMRAIEKIAQAYKSKVNFGLALPLGRAKLNQNRALLFPTEISLLRNLTEDQIIEDQTNHNYPSKNRFGECPCCANSFAITSNGNMSLCLGLRDLVICKINRQNIEESLNGWKTKTHDFQKKLSVDNVPVCLNCELRYSCKGGCRAVSFAYLGEIARNPFCEIYK